MRGSLKNDAGIQLVSIYKTPHYKCAREWLMHSHLISAIESTDACSIYNFCKSNKLTNSIEYMKYIRVAHPESNEVDEYFRFLSLFKELQKNTMTVEVLCALVINFAGRNFFALIDGMHRSSILLALGFKCINICLKVVPSIYCLQCKDKNSGG